MAEVDSEVVSEPESEDQRARRELMPILERQVGSLALSELDGVGPMALMRAIAWHNVLARLGIAVPLVVVHDVGCLMCGLGRSEEHTSELQSRENLVCRLLLEKKKS